MMISGFTIVRAGTAFDYPYLESIRSLLPLVDELIVNVGESDDDTLSQVKALSTQETKIKIIETHWPLDDPEKKRGGKILSEQTNIALERCRGDWCIYLQADEILHEADYPLIRKNLQDHLDDPRVDGLLFDYVHLYGSYDVVQRTRSAYRREVRCVKRSSGAKSVGDAQSFRKSDGSKLSVMPAGGRIFHYGWVRTPEAMREKTVFMDQLYHGSHSNDSAPATGDNYKYKRFWGLEKFKGIHPSVMSKRIAEKGWHWDLKASPFVWEWKDLKKIVLDFWEKMTGDRLFEYRSYLLLEEPRPFASLFVTTYEMPRHLEMVLAALEHQSYLNFELILCDDGSGPETKKIIDRFKKRAAFPVKHIWQPHQGFRKCRILNEGLRQSIGTILIYLDGDCVPNRHFVYDHVTHQEEGRFLAGRRVELGEKMSDWLSPDVVSQGFFNHPRLALAHSCLSSDSEHFQRSFRIPWGWLRKLLRMNRIDDMKGCNYSVSREAMLAINGFDESYEGYGREDTDVEIRLLNLGLEIKSMKGLAIQFHVWHPRRAFTPKNDTRLDEVKKNRIIRCESGVQRSNPAGL